MCSKTRQNTIDKILGLTPYEILGPNPLRKAFIFMPLPGFGGSASPIVAVPFSAGANQLWTVPNGVTQIVDGYVWGSGGNGDVNGANGGGGGGSGGFSSTGPLTVIPGTIYTVSVDAHGAAGTSKIVNPAAANAALANSGTNAVADAKGLGGADGTGNIHFSGKNAANGNLGGGSTGGGGGGAPGSFAAGNLTNTVNGGAGGGTVTRSPYGVGGTGGNGGILDANGNNGSSPGAGGGGAGGNTGAPLTVAGIGADGLAVIFYNLSNFGQAISMSFRQDVAAGRGILNYVPGTGFNQVVTDEDIGDAITLPWWIVSAVDLVPIQIVEISYDE